MSALLLSDLGCERERERALRELERLLRLLTALCGCPTAAVSLFCPPPVSAATPVEAVMAWTAVQDVLDVAAVGMEPRRQSREESLVARAAILGGAVSEALAEDERFREVRETPENRSLRFFASALVVDAGRVIGAVGVYDTLSMTFDEAQRTALEDIAALAAPYLRVLSDKIVGEPVERVGVDDETVRAQVGAMVDFSRLLQSDAQTALNGKQRDYLRLIIESGCRILQIVGK